MIWIVLSWTDLIAYSRQSSANSLTWGETDFGRSIICKSNNNGSSTVPCGTTDSTRVHEGCFTSTTTC